MAETAVAVTSSGAKVPLRVTCLEPGSLDRRYEFTGDVEDLRAIRVFSKGEDCPLVDWAVDDGLSRRRWRTGDNLIGHISREPVKNVRPGNGWFVVLWFSAMLNVMLLTMVLA